jgi:gamma-glutamyl:cysteine ligase YbdK (ATP-grasp superfamily)
VTLAAFAAYGIELEYMVVDTGTLAVRPVVDELLRRHAGAITGDFEDGAVTWSNELALHVVELKHTAPAPLRGGARAFAASAARADATLRGIGCRLLPGGMHPWMRPDEFRRWPHDNAAIYAAYDRIFDCRGHGWSNLQSCHLNLPFADDREFERVHLAARALLPLLPALSAASPFCEGRFTGWLDFRLETYRHNQQRVPRITGAVVPEPVRSRQQYFDTILRPMWADIAPLDGDGLLQEEWLNSRGAVAKFSRDALEIRLLDCQESPFCDFAICALVVAVLQALAGERWASLDDLAALPTEQLAQQLLDVARDADRAVVRMPALLAALGLDARAAAAGDVWRRLADAVLPDAAHVDADLVPPLQTILAHGPLARRMLDAVGTAPDAAALRALARKLADCLVPGSPPVFVPSAARRS